MEFASSPISLVRKKRDIKPDSYLSGISISALKSFPGPNLILLSQHFFSAPPRLRVEASPRGTRILPHAILKIPVFHFIQEQVSSAFHAHIQIRYGIDLPVAIEH